MATALETSFFQAERRQLDLIRCWAYPYGGKGGVNLSGNIRSLTIHDDLTKSSIEVSISFYDDTHFAAFNLAPGTWLSLWFFNQNTLKWDFPLKLYIWDRSVTDRNQRASEISAYDIMSFLHRSGPEDWLFTHDTRHPSGWTASEIAKFILNRMRVPFIIPNTTQRIRYLKMQAHTPYEAIVKAYSRHRELTSQKFTIRVENDKVAIRRLNIRTENTVGISGGLNLISADWSESLEEKVTQVVARSVDSNGNVKRKIVVTSPDSRRYGVIRRILDTEKDMGPKQLKALALEEMRLRGRITRKATIESEGILGLRAGNAVLLNDRGGTNLVGRFYVDSVQHNIEPGNHTMTLDLSWVARVPSLKVTDEELNEALQTGQGQGVQFPDPYTGRPFMNPLGAVKYKTISTMEGHLSRAFGNWQSDAAVDMAAPPGTPVYSAFTGTITKANLAKVNTHGGKVFGAQITIQNPESTLSAFYTHVTNVPAYVRAGKPISIGQQIGEITRWDAGGHHLHFGLYNGPANGNVRSKYLDPEELLKGAPSDATAAQAPVTPSSGQQGTPITGPRNDQLRNFARKLAFEYKIDPNFFEKQINRESHFDPAADNGEDLGIAQINRKAHPDLMDIAPHAHASLNWAAYTMATYLVSYRRRWDFAIAAYNAGPGKAAEFIKGRAKFSSLPAVTQSYIIEVTGTSAPTVQSYGPAPNVGGPRKYPPGVVAGPTR